MKLPSLKTDNRFLIALFCVDKIIVLCFFLFFNNANIKLTAPCGEAEAEVGRGLLSGEVDKSTSLTQSNLPTQSDENPWGSENKWEGFLLSSFKDKFKICKTIYADCVMMKK